jgi:glycosyltransferase involved in cell wall biosynthesis
MRVIALLAAYNEERFLDNCLKHLFQHGIEVYLIDNESHDRTMDVAMSYHTGQGLVGVETLPRNGVYSWRPILARKEQLATTLKADWFIHLDADEIRLPPCSCKTLFQAIAEVDQEGYNAINFMEFSFVPTRESPAHDHADFLQTMRWYYPFLPSFPNRLNAWKQQNASVKLAWSGGHQVRFPGLRMYPKSFPMRHYLFLSIAHAAEKYIGRSYDPGEVATGWHRARAALRAENITLQSESELRRYCGDDALDASNPLLKHPLFSI